MWTFFCLLRRTLRIGEDPDRYVRMGLMFALVVVSDMIPDSVRPYTALMFLVILAMTTWDVLYIAWWNGNLHISFIEPSPRTQRKAREAAERRYHAYKAQQAREDAAEHALSPQQIWALGILGLSTLQTPSAEELARARKKRLFEVHPDRNPGMGSQGVISVNQAYKILSA